MNQQEQTDSVFQERYQRFWEELGSGKVMVLSTSLNGIVSSRSMSIVILKEKLFFQTDCTFRKYRQLMENPHAALCAGNIQMEGICREVGTPQENEEFIQAFQTHFPNSFQRYSMLKKERLFLFEPKFIQRWLYDNGIPYVEQFDIYSRRYSLTLYSVE